MTNLNFVPESELYAAAAAAAAAAQQEMPQPCRWHLVSHGRAKHRWNVNSVHTLTSHTRQHRLTNGKASQCHQQVFFCNKAQKFALLQEIFFFFKAETPS